MSKTNKKKKSFANAEISNKSKHQVDSTSNAAETTLSEIAATEELSATKEAVTQENKVDESNNQNITDANTNTDEQNSINDSVTTEITSQVTSGEKVKESAEQPEPLHFGKELKKRIGSQNPAILKFVAAVPILGAATALKNGILISIVLIITVLLLNMIMYPLDRFIKPQFKHVTKFVLAGIIVTPFLMLSNYLVPTITGACEIYLPLTAICAIPMVETKYCGKKHGFSRTVLMAVVNGIGFTFVAVLFAIIRETLGKAMLYEKAIPFMNGVKLPFIVYPTGAFILLGFLAALWRKMFGVKGDKEE